MGAWLGHDCRTDVLGVQRQRKRLRVMKLRPSSSQCGVRKIVDKFPGRSSWSVAISSKFSPWLPCGLWRHQGFGHGQRHPGCCRPASRFVGLSGAGTIHRSTAAQRLWRRQRPQLPERTWIPVCGYWSWNLQNPCSFAFDPWPNELKRHGWFEKGQYVC